MVIMVLMIEHQATISVLQYIMIVRLWAVRSPCEATETIGESVLAETKEQNIGCPTQV
jgi:hypothetical protein